jgi:hypothetical protein
MSERGKFDEIGYWSEVKLDILREYAAACSAILAKQQGLYHVYIDGFAGAGIHVRKATGDLPPRSAGTTTVGDFAFWIPVASTLSGGSFTRRGS